MEYFTLLNLKKEPFSNSPDPDFFYGSAQHLDCLQKLELTIRLRQGLSVVIGDVGTGKTTLCRQLVRKLGGREDLVEAHLILDPSFSSMIEFLLTVCAALGIEEVDKNASDRQLKEIIKNHLFSGAVEQQKIIVLMIDEGQKLADFCLEALRELLNYETNNAKLLQIVIFAQEEFEQSIAKQANFADRIATLYHLTPLSFSDTRKMIRFRLQRASGNQRLLPDLFNFWAILLIYRVTGGYPRKIVMLCSKALISLIVQNGSKVTGSLVLACSRRMSLAGSGKKTGFTVAAAIALLLFAGLYFAFPAIKSGLDEFLPAHRAANERAAPAIVNGPEQQASEAITTPPAAPQTSTVSTKASDPLAAPVPESKVPPVPAIVELPSPKPQPTTPPEVPQDEIEGKTAAEQLPPQTSDTHTADNLPLLGNLRTAEGDVLSKMIARIYGRFNLADLAIVLEANPWISDIDTIASGTVIRFPANARPYSPPAASSGSFWIALARFDTLDDAYPFLRQYPDHLQPVLLVPSTTNKSDLVFTVILDVHFATEENAVKQKNLLPSPYRDKAEIFSSWPDGTLLLTSNTGTALH